MPPGQRDIGSFPRFGLNKFADRFPAKPDTIDLEISGEVESPVRLDAGFGGAPRVEQVSGFHCVTTWSARGLRWGGVRFKDVYETVIGPRARPRPGAVCIILRAQDGARARLPLEDLLADDVLLADQLNGAPLPLEHGAPLRLVAPQHYGYKSIKHLSRIEFRTGFDGYKPSSFAFMEHPRGRVMLEERGQYFPGWLLRQLYRPLIGGTVQRFAEASERHARQLS